MAKPDDFASEPESIPPADSTPNADLPEIEEIDADAATNSSSDEELFASLSALIGDDLDPDPTISLSDLWEDSSATDADPLVDASPSPPLSNIDPAAAQPAASQNAVPENDLWSEVDVPEIGSSDLPSPSTSEDLDLAEIDFDSPEPEVFETAEAISDQPAAPDAPASIETDITDGASDSAFAAPISTDEEAIDLDNPFVEPPALETIGAEAVPADLIREDPVATPDALWAEATDSDRVASTDADSTPTPAEGILDPSAALFDIATAHGSGTSDTVSDLPERLETSDASDRPESFASPEDLAEIPSEESAADRWQTPSPETPAIETAEHPTDESQATSSAATEAAWVEATAAESLAETDAPGTELSDNPEPLEITSEGSAPGLSDIPDIPATFIIDVGDDEIDFEGRDPAPEREAAMPAAEPGPSLPNFGSPVPEAVRENLGTAGETASPVSEEPSDSAQGLDLDAEDQGLSESDPESSPAWASTSEPNIEREATPISRQSSAAPMAVGSSRSASADEAGDLGPLSEKLPLSRLQTVGLLIALAVLGTLTYIGLSSNGNNNPTPESPPPASTSN